MTEPREAWAAYRALQLMVDAEIARDLERESGLSMADYEVLAAAVSMAGEEECVRVSRLAGRMHWAHSRLSRQLGRMERRGMIAREACELDGRGDDVLVTEAGRRVYEDAAPAYWESVRRHFTDLLTPEQLATLTEIHHTVAATP
ncbi:MarR family transcriptional regulator [Spirillospora sp. NPDC048819]|uniref:MarR family winged helix-turn-helix transcriptional regulator n=1 Tax=Spirillospora sp. NPDC048819 TaxID=3155268 RepID=UPI00340C3E64